MSNEGDVKVYNSKRFGMVLCEKHWKQIGRCGKILMRTIFDPNEIIVHDDYAEIVLYDRNNQEVARAIIDTEDIDKVKRYKWSTDNKGYVINNTNKIFLHRLVMDCPNELLVDHIFHNVLDNRKHNLRICSNSDNLKNQRRYKNNSSGHIGICWIKQERRYQVRIKHDGKSKYLGKYKTLEEAIAARRVAEEKYFGEFAYKEEVL